MLETKLKGIAKIPGKVLTRTKSLRSGAREHKKPRMNILDDILKKIKSAKCRFQCGEIVRVPIHHYKSMNVQIENLINKDFFQYQMDYSH